jgi:hypothetical protein
MAGVSSRSRIDSRVFRSVADEQRAEHDYWRSLSAAERLGMMWQLALDAWAFTGDAVAESRLPRDIVSVHRRRG